MVFKTPVVVKTNVSLLQDLASMLRLQQDNENNLHLSLKNQYFALISPVSPTTSSLRLLIHENHIALEVPNEDNIDKPHVWSLFACEPSESEEQARFYRDKLLVALLCSEIVGWMSKKRLPQPLAPQNPTEKEPERIAGEIFLQFGSTIGSIGQTQSKIMRLWCAGLYYISQLLKEDAADMRDIMHIINSLKSDGAGLETALQVYRTELQQRFAVTRDATLLKVFVAASAALLFLALGITCFYGAGIAAGLWLGVQSFFTALSTANGLAIATVICPVALGAIGGDLVGRFFTPKPPLHTALDDLTNCAHELP